MLRRFSKLILFALLISVVPSTSTAQYDEEQPADTEEGQADTAQVQPVDTIEASQAALEQAERRYREQAVEQAKLWLRRILFRGWMNPTTIGAWTTYSLTSWSEATGSYGPVEAKLTIHYLGPVVWLGKEAESLQAAFRLMDVDQTLIEFDLVIPGTQRLTETFRVLYRVDRGELQPITLSTATGEVDYDVLDRPTSAGPRHVSVYAGEFDTELFRGSGSSGAEVVINRTAAALPLEILILGYGNEGLTYSSSGNELEPRIKVTMPPSR